MSSSPTPPPPYSLQPPPYTRRQRKLPREPSPPRPPRVSSRKLLTEALNFAQRAVKLDLANADLAVAVTAYDEAIAILQRVITRRSQKPGIASEVDRVTSIVSQPSPSIPPFRFLSLAPGTVSACNRGLLFIAISLFFCSITDTQIVYANCVAHTKFPCQVMWLPPRAGFPRR